MKYIGCFNPLKIGSYVKLPALAEDLSYIGSFNPLKIGSYVKRRNESSIRKIL